MTDLSRNLLAAAREGLAPDPAIAARVRARVAATVAVPVAASAVGAKSATAAPAAVSGGALKLVTVLAVIGASTAGLIVAGRATTAASPSMIAASPGSATDDTVHQVVQVRSRETPPARTSTATSPSPSKSTMPKAVITPAQASDELPSLSREVELIDRAMLALRRDDAQGALATIAVFERETRGDGQMAEDAAAIAIEAHCQLKHSVSERLAAFDAKWPSSAQRTRLQTACYSR